MFNRTHAEARWPVTGTPLRDDMPVTGTLDLLLQRALCREASDIHIEPSCSPTGYRRSAMACCVHCGFPHGPRYMEKKRYYVCYAARHSA
ncbi:MAG: hypothetical protein ACR5LG_01895 [Sodalis sp. (in: enterobacteria)]|uniref:hypothetical protein n=1 Tax=Sodalis sp. (in: enterobacteria) TaxID=1898979 RepID=UPI003F3A5CA0